MKKGFTLAEVLITLGIIGIVAAMTIPTLLANIKGVKYRSKFKKSLSTVNQALRQNKAHYDWSFGDINRYGCANGAGDTSDNIMSICAIFNSNLAGATYYPSGKHIYNPPEVNSAYHVAYTLADGAIIMINFDAQNCTLPIGSVLNEGFLNTTKSYWYGGGHGLSNCGGLIDVNGKSLPNKITKCSKEETKKAPDKPCIVHNKDIYDIFPVVFHDSTVEPSTNASKYVFNMAK